MTGVGGEEEETVVRGVMTKTDGGKREEGETEREMFCCLHQQMPESPAAHGERGSPSPLLDK